MSYARGWVVESEGEETPIAKRHSHMVSHHRSREARNDGDEQERKGMSSLPLRLLPPPRSWPAASRLLTWCGCLELRGRRRARRVCVCVFVGRGVVLGGAVVAL
jgi:hypothetical protein